MWEIFKGISGKVGKSEQSPGCVGKIGLVICILLSSFIIANFSVRIQGIREIKLLIFFFFLSLKSRSFCSLEFPSPWHSALHIMPRVLRHPHFKIHESTLNFPSFDPSLSCCFTISKKPKS